MDTKISSSYTIQLKDVYLGYSSLFKFDKMTDTYYADFLISHEHEALLKQIRQSEANLRQYITQMAGSEKQVDSVLVNGDEKSIDMYSGYLILKCKSGLPFNKYAPDKTIYTTEPERPVFEMGSLVNALIKLKFYEYKGMYGISKYLLGVQYKGPGIQQAHADNWLDFTDIPSW